MFFRSAPQVAVQAGLHARRSDAAAARYRQAARRQRGGRGCSCGGSQLDGHRGADPPTTTTPARTLPRRPRRPCRRSRAARRDTEPGGEHPVERAHHGGRPAGLHPREARSGSAPLARRGRRIPAVRRPGRHQVGHHLAYTVQLQAARWRRLRPPPDDTPASTGPVANCSSPQVGVRNANNVCYDVRATPRTPPSIPARLPARASSGRPRCCCR